MAGIWDCHFHIFHDPLCDERSGIILNATQRGTVTDLLRVFASYGISHGVAVSAMPYGTDNRVMVSALRQSRALRGIAVVDPLISEVEFAALEDAGVIGVRVNLMTEGLRQLTEPGVDRLFAMMRSVGWFLQLHSAADDLVPAVEILKRARVRLMFDHFGRPHPAWGLGQAGFAAMLEFGRETAAVVKLSGPYRSSLAGPPYGDVDPYIEAAISAFGLDRCVWGSDWPFTNASTRVDYQIQQHCLSRWLPDADDRRQVLEVTPATLFGQHESGGDAAES